jgi:hypothetical protein
MQNATAGCGAGPSSSIFSFFINGLTAQTKLHAGEAPPGASVSRLSQSAHCGENISGCCGPAATGAVLGGMRLTN